MPLMDLKLKPRLFEWDLAPLVRLSPETLIGRERDAFEELMLALALAFNDLKSFIILTEALSALEKKLDDGINEKQGQRGGVEVYLMRMGAGSLHELLNLIRKQRAVVEEPRFQELIERCEPEAREGWLSLLSVADDQTHQLSSLLVRIRNNVSFHYHQPKVLAAGYRKFFFDDPSHDASSAAFVSHGRSMEETRYYFADAAAQRAMSMQLDVKTLRPRIEELIQSASVAIWGVLAVFFHDRDPGSFPAPASAKTTKALRRPAGPSREKREVARKNRKR